MIPDAACCRLSAARAGGGCDGGGSGGGDSSGVGTSWAVPRGTARLTDITLSAGRQAAPLREQTVLVTSSVAVLLGLWGPG